MSRVWARCWWMDPLRDDYSFLQIVLRVEKIFVYGLGASFWSLNWDRVNQSPSLIVPCSKEKLYLFYRSKVNILCITWTITTEYYRNTSAIASYRYLLIYHYQYSEHNDGKVWQIKQFILNLCQTIHYKQTVKILLVLCPSSTRDMLMNGLEYREGPLWRLGAWDVHHLRKC